MRKDEDLVDKLTNICRKVNQNFHIIRLVEVHDGKTGYFSNRFYIDDNNIKLQRIQGDIDVLLTSFLETEEDNENIGNYFIQKLIFFNKII